MDLLAGIQRLMAQMSNSHINRGRAPRLARSSSEVLQLRSKINQCAGVAASCREDPRTQEYFTNYGNAVKVSKTPLKNLKRISLGDLRLEEAAKGGYLVLRTLEPAYKLVSINTAVEDHEGNAVFFQVFNFTADLSPNLDDILPVGTVFILKEPCFTMSGCNNNCTRVVCYSPSDIIILYKGHELFKLAEGIIWKNYIDPELLVDPVWRHLEPKDASEWKRRGNDFYNQGKFEYAARCYLLGLQKIAELGEDDPLMQILQLNLSATYLQLGFFEKALDFAEKVLMVEPGSRKALLRAGRSCYQLRKYQDAKLHFEKCHSLYPDDKETKIELQKSKDRCCEQETGEFDMYKMHLSQDLHSRQKLDCADYVGPIKVIETEGKGRSVVATRDLEPGTLLVVSKAVVFEWLPENKIQHEVNSYLSRSFENNQDVVTKLAHLIAKNPHTFGPIVYDLGIKHVKNVSVELFCDPETNQEPIVDVQRLNDICDSSGFCANSSLVNPENIFALIIPETIYPLGEGGSGLFAVPSYFNHSCYPNANFRIFNDVMFVRAITYIKAEEEVFLSYFDQDHPFPLRRFFCEKRGYHCCCILCKQDTKLPNSIHCQREKITSKFHEISQQMEYDATSLNPKLVQHQLKKLINEMDATYNNCGPDPVKLRLFAMYIRLVHACSGTFDIDGETEHLFNALALFGFSPQILLSALEKGESLIPPNAFLSPHVLETVALLIEVYHKTGQTDLKSKWIEIMCGLEKVYSGGDINVVKLNCKIYEEVF